MGVRYKIYMSFQEKVPRKEKIKVPYSSMAVFNADVVK
jgi:hypothetical protein